MRSNKIKFGLMFILIMLVMPTVNAAVGDPYNKVATSVMNVVCGFMRFFWRIIGLLGVVIIASAAVQWVISRDEPAKRKQARDIVVAVIIGLVLAAMTKTIINGITASVGGFPTTLSDACFS